MHAYHKKKKELKNQHSFKIFPCKKRSQILFKNFQFFPLIPALDHCGTITETQASSFEGLQILLGKKV